MTHGGKRVEGQVAQALFGRQIKTAIVPVVLIQIHQVDMSGSLSPLKVKKPVGHLVPGGDTSVVRKTDMVVPEIVLLRVNRVGVILRNVRP